MILPTDHLYYPHDTPDGPFGVGSTAAAWYVVNRHTGHAKHIGRVRSKIINYFDRALEEAYRRNTEGSNAPAQETTHASRNQD